MINYFYWKRHNSNLYQRYWWTLICYKGKLFHHPFNEKWNYKSPIKKLIKLLFNNSVLIWIKELDLSGTVEDEDVNLPFAVPLNYLIIFIQHNHICILRHFQDLLDVFCQYQYSQIFQKNHDLITIPNISFCCKLLKQWQ